MHEEVQSSRLTLSPTIVLLRPYLLQFTPHRLGILAYENEVNLNSIALRPQFLVLLHNFLVLGCEIKALEYVRCVGFVGVGEALDIVPQFLAHFRVQQLVVVVACLILRELCELREGGRTNMNSSEESECSPPLLLRMQ
jgi:hypothetical protein